MAAALRLLRAALLALAVLLALPASANPEDDVDFLTRTLQSLLSDAGREVRIRGFEGALSSRATITELTISDSRGVWLVMRGLVLDWDRAALFSRRVEVNELAAELIEIRRAPAAADGPDLPSPTARAPFALPELPVSIRVGGLRAERVALGADLLGEAAAFRLDGAVALEGGQGEARIEALRIDGGDGRFTIRGGFDNASRVLDLDIALAEGPGGIAAGLLGIPDRPAIALEARGRDPIAAFRADLSLATDGRERLAGQATFLDTSPEGRALDGAVFRLDVGGDLRPLLAPDLHGFFGADTRLVAEGSRSDTGEIRLAELAATTRAFSLQGRADLTAQGLPQLIDLNLQIADDGGAPVVLPGTQGQGRLAGANLMVSFDAATSPDWTVLGRIDGLTLPQLALDEVVLDARGVLGAGEGADGGGGPVFDGVFEFAALGITAADPAVQAALGPEVYGLVSLHAPGGGAPLELAGMAVEGQAWAFTGQGALDGLAFDGFLEAEVPDLTPFSGLAGRPLGGAALATLRGQVNPLTGAFDVAAELATTDLRLDLPEADNLLAGRAAIEVSARRDTEGTVLRRLSVQAGTLGLGAEGRIDGASADLTARLRLSDLGRLGAGYAGGLGLDLGLALRDGDWQADLTGEMADLRIGDRPGAAQVAGLFAGRTALAGRIGLRSGALRIETLAMTGPQVGIELSGVASAAAQTLAIRLDRLAMAALAPGGAGAIAGRADLSGAVGARRLVAEVGSAGALRTGIAPLDGLLAGGARLRLTGAEAGGDTRLEAFELAATGLDLAARGRLGGDGALALDLSGGIDSLARLAPGLEGAARIEGRLARPAGGQDIDARLAIDGPSALNAMVEGRIAPDLRLALAVAGSVEAGIANAFIAPATVQGNIRFDGAVNGPPALSSLRLAARVEGGRYVQPGAGVAFGGITGTADLSGAVARVRLAGESLRGGTVAAEGSLTLFPTRTVDLTATATRLRIAQPRLFEGAVSGTVRMAGSLVTGPTASGRLTVDEAEIRIPNSPLARSGFVPEGLRHTGEAAAARATRLNAGIAAPRAAADAGAPRRMPLFLDLELDAPGRIFVRGRGLDAELGGTLRLGGTTVDMIPAGAFSLIRGRLDLLGNRFTLTDGSASFIGSFMPVVRLVATTESGGVVTSVVLQGPVDAPEIRFESVPELPQDEVLARLLFGRALSSLSPFQAAQLGLSVATLTGRAEASFIDRTRQALGLDDLDFTTDERGATALRAGRYIGERVYTNLSVDSQGRGEVRLQLDLTPSLTLRGRADSEGRSAVGIFFERDY